LRSFLFIAREGAVEFGFIFPRKIKNKQTDANKFPGRSKARRWLPQPLQTPPKPKSRRKISRNPEEAEVAKEKPALSLEVNL